MHCTTRRLGSVAGPCGPSLLQPQSILPASSPQGRCYTSHPTILTLLSDKEHFQNSSFSLCRKRARRQVPDQASIWVECSKLTAAFSPARCGGCEERRDSYSMGEGGGRQSCAQRHGEEEGEEENKERENKVSTT